MPKNEITNLSNSTSSPSSTVAIALKNVTKRFTTKKLGEIVAVDDFNLEVKAGECFAFLGPSGCGKTTTLRMIAGFEDLSEGEIFLNGKLVSSSQKHVYVQPEDRNLGMVFQAFAVWPHMTVFDNVAFPLKVRKRPKAEIKSRVAEALEHTGLTGLEKSYPDDLSGGGQQRIALARAIVTEPDIMLLDEPLSNLDPQLRESMRFEIKDLQRQFGFTIIFVTHDQSEAMALSDRMLVMDMGKIVQLGTPKELYNRPVNRFVHSFLGESCFTEMNIENGKAYVQGSPDPLKLDPPKGASGKWLLSSRPDSVGIAKSGGVPGIISKCTYLPDYIEYLVRIGEAEIKVQSSQIDEFQAGQSCGLSFPNAVWYPYEDDSADKERTRRQLI